MPTTTDGWTEIRQVEGHIKEAQDHPWTNDDSELFVTITTR